MQLRGLPDIVDPNAPADAADVGPTATPENWIGALHNEGTDQDKDVLLNMLTQNKEAPYPFENDGVNTDTMYPGGANQGTGVELHDFVPFTSTTIGEQNYVKGGSFPGGLIKFDCTNFASDTNIFVLIDLVPCHHRGYLARPMQDM